MHLPTRVGARVAEGTVLERGVLDRRAAQLLTSPYVATGVCEVVGINLVPRTAARVRGEDAIQRARVAHARVAGVAVDEVRVGGGEVAALVILQPNLARLVAAVPPDLVRRVPTAGLEVAHRQIVDADVVGLKDYDPVPAEAVAEVLVSGRRIALAG